MRGLDLELLQVWESEARAASDSRFLSRCEYRQGTGMLKDDVRVKLPRATCTVCRAPLGKRGGASSTCGRCQARYRAVGSHGKAYWVEPRLDGDWIYE